MIYGFEDVDEDEYRGDLSLETRMISRKVFYL